MADIEALLQQQPDAVVVIDEAYVDFGGESAIALVDRYPNLLVVQTLSKSRSLAGLRVGFAVGDAALIEALERVKNSFNSYPLDRLAIVKRGGIVCRRGLLPPDLSGGDRHPYYALTATDGLGL
ncbi:aminotransferase class I/II-fold pyridoxal phosphate-dependent enzyme [Paludibacterium denitrificans]|uniref:aminotransferase class I/II-fold pyridoxal phosphate-dependent enzyme n=1 Tax=Paludibacterium denitrificans TaxID=2675226 RepID=UPI002478164D|nr:aminotransferase class I/II-fold pyridoxal phosphate-dependent enzyme [Paludibacterium denitrificans]